MFNHSAVSECILLLLIKIAAKITLKLNIAVTKITITEIFDVQCLRIIFVMVWEPQE